MSQSVSQAQTIDPEPQTRRGLVARRWGIVLALLIVVALIAVVTFAAVTVRRPLPQVDGEIELPGLDASVTVMRDARGIPHITADSSADLFRAQGYVHAQDRFFQMDLRRHATSGRLAELVGGDPRAIASDKVIRTLGWRNVAEQEFQLLSEESKGFLQAYAEGVNAYLETHGTGAIAIEYAILGQKVDVAEPAPWDPIDSLTWLKAMAWDLRSNHDDELARARIYGKVQDVQLVNELFPAYSEVNQTILAPAENRGQTGPEPAVVDDSALDGTVAGDEPVEDGVGTDQAEGAANVAEAVDLDSPVVQQVMTTAHEALAAVPSLLGQGDGIGSNSWAVSGSHTASGKPMLANDPHLGLSSPGVWSQIGLHCRERTTTCDFDVTGFSFAGFPGVVIGHNGAVAWGLTNMGADVTDFFIERVRGNAYVDGALPSNDQFTPMESRTETIAVNGGANIDIEVRSTKHGPIVSGVWDLEDVTHAPTDGPGIGEYQVSLAWTALTPGHTAEAIFAFDRASSVEDIRAAARLFDVPAQNIVFVTSDGHIGYQAPGRVPVRQEVEGRTPSDGSWPRPGYDARYDWGAEYVDPDRMPWAVDPADGILVAANQAVLPTGAGPYLTRDWDYGYRAQRIRDLLNDEIANGRPVSVSSMAAIQDDNHSPQAEVLMRDLLDQQIDLEFDQDGQRLLAEWDMQMDADSAAAAYFAVVWRNVLTGTFADELPEGAQANGGSRWLAVLADLLDDPENQYWDDKGTFGVKETRDEILNDALVSARRDLIVALSKESSDWQWGKLHRVNLQHEALPDSALPWFVADYLSPDAVPVSGGSSIVNATSWDASSGSFDVTAGPSMRMVVDMGKIDNSTWVTSTGISGHPASRHHGDQLTTWINGESYPWPFTSHAVRRAAEDTLTLVP